jgi:hypothetical protein
MSNSTDTNSDVTKFLSMKNIACVGQEMNKFELKKVHAGPTQKPLKKNMSPNLGFLAVKRLCNTGFSFF